MSHSSQDVCPYNAKFARVPKEPAYASREALGGKDARTPVREHAGWALGELLD